MRSCTPSLKFSPKKRIVRAFYKQLSLFVLIAIAAVSFSHLIEARSFMISCWVPYWRCATAIQAVQDRIDLFNQISPFSYEVKPGGLLKDPFKKNSPLWEALRARCAQTNTLVVPTIFWTDTQEMHAVFSDRDKLKKHKNAILELVFTHQFDGININYERIDSKDRKAYSTLLEELSKELHRNRKVLHISVGGRTSDSTIGLMKPSHKPPFLSISSLKKRLSSVSLNPGSGKEALRYKRIIAECCDQVHIMGYDEWGTPYRSNPENLANEYYISHASNQWIEQIILYALSYIPRYKIVLGIPTYGLEFAITTTKGSLSFEKKRNVNYKVATELSLAMQKKPRRTAGGELSFTYNNGQESRYVCYLNAQSIKEKIALVKKYRIKGINMFTINGNEDNTLWDTLEKELLFSTSKEQMPR